MRLVFTIPETGPNDNNPVYLTPNVLDAFEAGDQREICWVNNVRVGVDTFYFPYKYKSANVGDPITEYLTILRLGEQYLIRAEARAQQNNLSGALNDLNAIRSRAGLTGISTNDLTALLDYILHERQVELFSEWRHRWLDLKRTGKVDDVMSKVAAEKGGNWDSNWQWYPLPVGDLQKNINLTQNAGY